MSSARPWEGTTYGSRWMHSALIALLRHIDVRWVYVFAYVFVVPICVVVRKGSRAIYRYCRRCLQRSFLGALWLTYVNHCRFAEVVIDRFAMYAGHEFAVAVDGYELFDSMVKSDRSCVMLSAHIGNYELAGYTLVSEDRAMNALVYANEKATVMHSRAMMFHKTHITMIPIAEDMSHLYALSTALQRREIVSMPADRVFGSKKTIAVTLFSHSAQLPRGPFSIATMYHSGVLAVNVMKESWTRYRIYVRQLEYSEEASRHEQEQQLAQAYIANIEWMLRKYPAQWYNYYDFFGYDS